MGPDRSAAVLVRGTAGIGKSTLCGELVASARERRWRVATVAAGAAGGAYATVAAAVDQLLGRDRTLLDRIPATARPVLAS